MYILSSAIKFKPSTKVTIKFKATKAEGKSFQKNIKTGSKWTQFSVATAVIINVCHQLTECS